MFNTPIKNNNTPLRVDYPGSPTWSVVGCSQSSNGFCFSLIFPRCTRGMLDEHQYEPASR